MRDRRPARPRRPPPQSGAAPLPLRHPALLAAALVAAACVLVSVSDRIYDTDLWHHLLVGRVIWETHAIPTRQLWSWPTYGAVDANNAWLFRALLWPLWAAGGVWGLFAWRWVSTLAVFGILWAAARRMGARGLTPLVVMAALALVYRQRSHARPETLAALLLALQLWILAGHRLARDRAATAPGGGASGRASAVGLVLIAWAWANTHPSYYLGFVILGLRLLDDLLAARRARGAAAAAARASARSLLSIAGLGLAVSFLNPWGWRPLWQPFTFALTLRHEALYQSIGELRRLDWANNDRNGLAVLMVLWPALAIWRWRRAGLDVVEGGLIVLLTPLMLSAQRFTGTWAVAAAAFLARDLDAWVGARRWPVWTRPAWARAGLAAVACVGLGIPEWRRVEHPLVVGLDMARYPVRACDFMAAHGVRGRGFNDFRGGYQAWRFWPDRERLPFMTGTPEAASRADRDLLALALTRAEGWRRLDARHQFDYALVNRYQSGDGPLLDFIDADSTWALVFADDAAALYLKRGRALDPVIAAYAYRWLPGGTERLAALGRAALADSVVRGGLERELIREARESPYDSQALSLLAREAFVARRWDEARRYTEASLRAEPLTPGEHERLGLIDLAQARPREALEELRRERRLRTSGAALDVRFGQAYAALGETGRARGYLRRALQHDPGDPDAAAALARLGGAGGR